LWRPKPARRRPASSSPVNTGEIDCSRARLADLAGMAAK